METRVLFEKKIFDNNNDKSVGVCGKGNDAEDESYLRKSDLSVAKTEE